MSTLGTPELGGGRPKRTKHKKSAYGTRQTPPSLFSLRSRSGGSIAAEGKGSLDEDEELDFSASSGSSLRPSSGSIDLRSLDVGSSSSASGASFLGLLPSYYGHLPGSSSAASYSYPSYGERLASATVPLAGTAFGIRASAGGSASVAAGSGAPVTAAGSGAPVTAGGRTAGGAAPGTPYTNEQKERLRQSFLMVGDAPMQSAADGASFSDEDLRAFLNDNRTPQQLLRYWQHVGEILKKQMSAGQLSSSAKINVGNLQREIENKIEAARHGGALAAGIPIPPGTAAGFGGSSSATAAPGSSGSSSGIATGGSGGLPPVGCPCPEIATAIQALSATMGTSGSAAIQAQITGIEQRLAALQLAAEQRVLAAEAARNAAQAEALRLQGELTAARAAATSGSSSSSASSSVADAATIADLTTRLQMQSSEHVARNNELIAARADIVALNTQIQQAQAAAATQAAQLQQENMQLRTESTTKDGDIARLTASNAALSQQITTMQAVTAQSASNANASAAQLRTANTELLTQLQAATAAHATEKAELEAQLAAMAALHSQQQAAAAQCNQELAALTSSQETFLQSMGELSFQDILAAQEALSNELSETKTREAECNTRLSEVTARIAQLQPENASLKSESSSKTQEIERLDKELLALKATSDASIANAKTSSEAEAAAKEALMERLNAVEAAKTACDAAASQTATELATLRGTLASLEGEIETTKQSLEAVTQAEAQATQTLTTLGNLFPGKDLATSIQTLKTNLEKISAEKADCDEAVAARDANIVELRKENEKVQAEIVAKVAEITMIKSSLDVERNKSNSLETQIKDLGEKTAANVTAARETASTAQKKALDELTAQLEAAIAALKKAQSEYKTDITLKDAKIAGLEAHVKSLIGKRGHVATVVNTIEEGERARSRSPTSHTKSSSTSASAVPPGEGGRGRSTIPTTKASAGGGGEKPKGSSTATTGSGEVVKLTTSPLHGGESQSASSSASSQSASASSGSPVDLTSVVNPMGQRPQSSVASMSLSPIPLPSATQSRAGGAGLTSNPLYTPTSASAVATVLTPPTGKPGSKPSAGGGGGKLPVVSSVATTAASAEQLQQTSNPFAGNNKLKTKKRRNNYKRKTRKNRK